MTNTSSVLCHYCIICHDLCLPADEFAERRALVMRSRSLPPQALKTALGTVLHNNVTGALECRLFMTHILFGCPVTFTIIFHRNRTVVQFEHPISYIASFLTANTNKIYKLKIALSIQLTLRPIQWAYCNLLGDRVRIRKEGRDNHTVWPVLRLFRGTTGQYFPNYGNIPTQTCSKS